MARNDRSDRRDAPRVSTDPANDDMLSQSNPLSSTGTASNPWTEEDVHAFERETSRVGDLFARGRDAMRTGYDRTLSYGRENPGMLLAVGFGIGLALGLLLAVPAARSRAGHRGPDFEI